MKWIQNLFRRQSCADELGMQLALMRLFFTTLEGKVMTIVSDLTDAATKIAADVDAAKTAFATALAAKDATISDLQAQLAALQGDAAAITAATATITDADAKLTAA